MDGSEPRFRRSELCDMSVLMKMALEQLEKAISACFSAASWKAADLTYVSNVRHIALLEAGTASLEGCDGGDGNRIPIDMIQIDVRTAWEHLGEIIGDTVSESLIDQIFSQFCLGK